jgi:hypothetical protein
MPIPETVNLFMHIVYHEIGIASLTRGPDLLPLPGLALALLIVTFHHDQVCSSCTAPLLLHAYVTFGLMITSISHV